ncbi:MAG: hypothetical protein H0T15_08800 [Thermoleophilaceae bacterium]|nr:hypothetical protein [Thermoleophilaceae bacterium]
MASERGQATVEWTGTTLLITLAFIALIGAVPAMGGTSLGAAIEERIVCAVKGERCGVRVATRSGPVLASASVTAIASETWVAGLHWKKGMSKSDARDLARAIRDVGLTDEVFGSWLKGKLPGKLAAVVVAASGYMLEQYAREIDDAVFEAGPHRAVCIHYGAQPRFPLPGGVPFKFGLTAWPKTSRAC